jgi:uncharacterized YccA/Bax inhibitor family protein
VRTANPALSERTFAPALSPAATSPPLVSTQRMTVDGTVNKTALLLALVLASGAWTWSRVLGGEAGQVVDPAARTYLIGGAITGLVLALVTTFRPQIAHITAPLYALAEGVFLGAISATLNVFYPGIPLQAAGLTVGVLAVMLVLYRTGVIRVTDKFRAGVVAATGAIFLIYLVSFVLRVVGVEVPLLNDNGVLGIGISLVIVAVAALNLVLDFDLIAQGARHGAPVRMEWYGAFALLVTLVWLYVELLRLLTKLQSRD